jgi:pseudouridine synthase
VIDLLPEEMRRVFPVGRLDRHSEGLILLTDDGELAHRLTHPRYQHPKTYYVLVAQRPPESALAQFRSGIDLPEGRTAPAAVRVVERLPAELRLSKGPTEGIWLEVVLREGKKRQIRHMTAAIGYPTLRLVRWAIGSLTLGDLKLGEHAPLSHREVGLLRQMVAAPRNPVDGEPSAARRRPAARRNQAGPRVAPRRTQPKKR